MWLSQIRWNQRRSGVGVMAIGRSPTGTLSIRLRGSAEQCRKDARVCAKLEIHAQARAWIEGVEIAPGVEARKWCDCSAEGRALVS